jgi:hypothetical protein
MCMVFTNKESRVEHPLPTPQLITADGLNLAWVKILKYLGVYIMGLLHNGNVQCDVSCQVAKFNGAVHFILKRCANEFVVVHLIKHYVSSHSVLWA